uniref:Uracil-DNA glycosylase-like domain-containing protein n=1 Tax=Cebus imitator TaxID=2715852 RepID=A0A2K5RXY0_CEBIM
ARKRRTPSPEPSGDAATSPAKKAWTEQDEPGTPPSSPLSAEQLAARNVPVGFEGSSKGRLRGEFRKPYFSKLMGFVAEERKHCTVYSPQRQVFTWTPMCDIRDENVVVLGQDLYHGPNQAHGLCFSVQSPAPPPPNLENIYKELSTDIEGFVHSGHGDLSARAKQGVLLLNAVVTVRTHQASSHKERGWEQFTHANSDGLVFLLWGSYVQKDSATDCPSLPLSVYRGFFGCRHFSKTNELLWKSGKKPIGWKEL